MKVNTRILKRLGIILVFLVILHFLGQESRKHFYLNWTPSVPVGLYKLSPLQGQLRRGDLILMTVPGTFKRYIYGRKWLPAGWPLLKNVAALPGENFCTRGPYFTIEGKYVAKVYPMDNEGLPLPRKEGCWIVRPGHFLPMATHIPNSFDGRYMGDISEDHIIAKATPLLTR